MFSFWNGPMGGSDVKPRKGMRSFWEYNPEEKKTCFKSHFEKKVGIAVIIGAKNIT